MLQVAAFRKKEVRIKPMTAHLTNHDPQYWRDLAQKKRDLANRMHTIGARASFMNAAEYYEQMAMRFEATSDEPEKSDSVPG